MYYRGLLLILNSKLLFILRFESFKRSCTKGCEFACLVEFVPSLISDVFCTLFSGENTEEALTKDLLSLN